MSRLAPLLAHVDPKVKALIVAEAEQKKVSLGTVVREILDRWAIASGAIEPGTTPPATPPDEAPSFLRTAAPHPPVTRDALQPEEARR